MIHLCDVCGARPVPPTRTGQRRNPGADGKCRCPDCQAARRRGSRHGRQPVKPCTVCGEPAGVNRNGFARRQCKKCLKKRYYWRQREKASKRKGRPITQAEADAAWKRQQGRCAYCGHASPRETMDLDHRVPIWAGGGAGKNLQYLCREVCHRVKTWAEQRRRRHLRAGWRKHFLGK